MGTPTAPTARGYTELVAYFAKMDNCDLEVLAAQSDFGDISEVGGVSVRKQERGKSRMGNIENAMGYGDMFERYLTKAANVFNEGK